MIGTMMSVTTKGMTRGAAMQMKTGIGGTGTADLVVSGAPQGIMTETVETRHTETERACMTVSTAEMTEAESSVAAPRAAASGWRMLPCPPRRATQTLTGRYQGMRR